MHHTNHYYGHAHVLARYAGRPTDPPPRIWGYLQHGWNVGTGLDPALEYVPGVPRLVWSDGPRRRGRALGLRDYEVVGAPWAYLLTFAPPGAGSRSGTIFYPFHGWERQAVVGNHRRLAKEIRLAESDRVTVCLYWLDHKDRDIRRAYAEQGFRVITHGPRGSHRRGVDPAFLHRQLTELRRHRRVASNRLSTAIWYGASVGCDVGVYGDPMRLAAEDTAPAELIRREWPELHQPDVPAKLAADVARAELGQDRLRAPDELAELLGWSRPPQPADPATALEQLRWLDRVVQERDAELARTRASVSYRLGNAVVRPVGALRTHLSARPRHRKEIR